jgi:CheY-like chemotaxis protein
MIRIPNTYPGQSRSKVSRSDVPKRSLPYGGGAVAQPYTRPAPWRIGTRRSGLGRAKVLQKPRLPYMPPTESPEHGRQLIESLRGKRVLLVDDNEVNLVLGVELLGQVGLCVTTASAGLEAICQIQTATFDLVLMDVQMPNMNGLEATKLIRALPTAVGLSIVAMTASVLPQDRQDCLDAGMNDHLAKPIDREALLRMISTWIR